MTNKLMIVDVDVVDVVGGRESVRGKNEQTFVE